MEKRMGRQQARWEHLIDRRGCRKLTEVQNADWIVDFDCFQIGSGSELVRWTALPHFRRESSTSIAQTIYRTNHLASTCLDHCSNCCQTYYLAWVACRLGLQTCFLPLVCFDRLRIGYWMVTCSSHSFQIGCPPLVYSSLLRTSCQKQQRHCYRLRIYFLQPEQEALPDLRRDCLPREAQSCHFYRKPNCFAAKN